MVAEVALHNDIEMSKKCKNCPKNAKNYPKLSKIDQNSKVTSVTIFSTLCTRESSSRKKKSPRSMRRSSTQ